MSKGIVYEFPLNEKLRAYLRIETLLNRAQHANTTEHVDSLGLFQALFDLVEVLDRSDLRADMLKDLEQQEAELERWASAPNAHVDKIKELRNTLSRCNQRLRSEPRLANTLKNDRFLASIRQRFSIPGGNCCFDVPQLHYWLNLPTEVQRQHFLNWMEQLSTLSTAIEMLLTLMREVRPFKAENANNGFFQDSADNLQLLRIRCAPELGCYPMVSGNRHRFAIRFMAFIDGDDRAVDHSLSFELARC